MHMQCNAYALLTYIDVYLFIVELFFFFLSNFSREYVLLHENPASASAS